MKHFKSRKSNELELAPVATPISSRYCGKCHLSTPNANQRCIHCRYLQPTTRVLARPVETRVA